MQIIDIASPEDNNIKSDDDLSNTSVGIDFGTTNSLAAIFNEKSQKSELIYMNNISTATSILGYKIIALDNCQDYIKSTLRFDDKEKIIYIGKAKESSISDKSRLLTIFSIKRLLSLNSKDIKKDDISYIISDVNALLVNHNGQIIIRHNIKQDSIDGNDSVSKTYELSLSEVISFIFSYIKANIATYLNKNLSKQIDYKSSKINSVISVPAYFDDNAKGQIIYGAKIAGFEIKKILTEPTAGAVSYGFNNPDYDGGSYIIYDFGGGTFDVSILNMEKSILQVVSSDGDPILGGDDIDICLAKYISQKYKIDLDNKLINFALLIKEYLTDNDIFTGKYLDKEINISKDEFNRSIEEIINKTINLTKNALIAAEDKLNYEIELGSITNSKTGIILVGGSSRIPIIKEKLRNIFHCNIYDEINPDYVVCYGSAKMAHNLVNQTTSKNTLIDVLPLSLAIEVYGGITEKIILRNTPIPFSVKKEFTTYADYQNGMKFNILQGERELAKDCKSIGFLEITNLPKRKSGMVSVEVTFTVDNNGILFVSVYNEDSKTCINSEFNPHYRQDQKQIDDMLISGFKNAKNDHENKLLIQSKTDAEKLITDVKDAIDAMPSLISEELNKNITEAIEFLQDSLKDNNRDVILDRFDKLNKLAEKLMEKHLSKIANDFVKNRKI